MIRSDSHQETEIKLALPNAAEVRRRLKRAKFVVVRRRVLECNTIFDTADRQLRQQGVLLRLRTAGRRHILTYKSPIASDKHKSREELELEIPDTRKMRMILERLGFKPAFEYEKYRTEYAQADRRGLAMLDETPIGDFLELEGPPEWIDDTAARLGFAESDYIKVSYITLYLSKHRDTGVDPKQMLFRRSV